MLLLENANNLFTFEEFFFKKAGYLMYRDLFRSYPALSYAVIYLLPDISALEVQYAFRVEVARQGNELAQSCHGPGEGE